MLNYRFIGRVNAKILAQIIAFRWHQKASAIIFSLIIGSFLLPFVVLHQENQQIREIAGAQLAAGINISELDQILNAEGAFFWQEHLMIFIFIYSLIGLVTTTIKLRQNAAILPAISATVGLTFSGIVRSHLDYLSLSSAQIKVDYGIGFYLMILLFLAVSCLNWFIFIRHNRTAKWMTPLALLSPAGICLILLLILPTLVIFELSLVPNIRPGDLVNPSGLDNYWRVFEPINLQVIARSLFFAFGTTIICLLLGFPVAYWLAQQTPKKWRGLLLLAFILPLWTSSLLRTYAWITILRPTGILNSILSFFGLPNLAILNRPAAVFIGMAYSYLPYMVLILYASLEKLDRRLLEAAYDLGANEWKTFWQVTVPQTLPGITAGSLLVLITGLGDFVDPELLGGASSMTVSRLIYNQFLGATRNWGFGSALSMVLIFGVSVAIALLIKYADNTAMRS